MNKFFEAFKQIDTKDLVFLLSMINPVDNESTVNAMFHTIDSVMNFIHSNRYGNTNYLIKVFNLKNKFESEIPRHKFFEYMPQEKEKEISKCIQKYTKSKDPEKLYKALLRIYDYDEYLYIPMNTTTKDSIVIPFGMYFENRLYNGDSTAFNLYSILHYTDHVYPKGTIINKDSYPGSNEYVLQAPMNPIVTGTFNSTYAYNCYYTVTLPRYAMFDQMKYRNGKDLIHTYDDIAVIDRTFLSEDELSAVNMIEKLWNFERPILNEMDLKESIYEFNDNIINVDSRDKQIVKYDLFSSNKEKCTTFQTPPYGMPMPIYPNQYEGFDPYTYINNKF